MTASSFLTRLSLVSAFALALSLAVKADPSQLESAPQGWQNIQPAADLSGWTRVGIPPGHPLGRAQWHVDSPGILVCDGDGGHEMLRYDREIGDCIFHVEFRFFPLSTNANYNSGVYARNSADGTVWYQVQLTMDGGYLFGSGPVNGQTKHFNLKPSERRMKPAGEWNTVELTAKGHTLTAWLNGAQTCSYPDCDVDKGYVAVESEGYKIEFRNIKLKELRPRPARVEEGKPVRQAQ